MSEETEETQVEIDRTSDELKKKQFAASSKETKLGYEGKSLTKLFPAKKDAGESKSKTVPSSEHQDPGSPKPTIPMRKIDQSSSVDEPSSADKQQQHTSPPRRSARSSIQSLWSSVVRKVVTRPTQLHQHQEYDEPEFLDSLHQHQEYDEPEFLDSVSP